MLHIFDLDHTLFKKNASVSFGAYLYRNKEFSFFKMLHLLSLYSLHKCKLLSLPALHQTIFSNLFKNQSASHYMAEVQKFLDHHLQDLLDKIIFEKLQTARGETALLSSSPDFLVEAIAKRLNVNFWMGSTYVIENGVFSFLSHVVNGKDKALKARELSEKLQIPFSEITAYSDSFLDIPLLEMVGHPVTVNPDRRLLKEGRIRGWIVLKTHLTQR